MTILFKDGEESFPGDLPVKVVYSVTDNNQMVLSYDAVAANKKTVANFTGHAFFNLTGDLGKGSRPYTFRSGFCLEPSRFPDSLNHQGFPTTVLKHGEWYSGTIIYKFSTNKEPGKP